MADPVQRSLVTAHYGHYGQRAAWIRLDCICWIRHPASNSVAFFQRRPGWPGQVSAKRIWSGSQPACKNVHARFWQNTTGPLPVSPFQTWLHSSTDGLDHNYCAKPACKTSSSWLCQVLAKRIRSGNKPVCKNRQARFWPMLPSWSRSDANQIQFTGEQFFKTNLVLWQKY